MSPVAPRTPRLLLVSTACLLLAATPVRSEIIFARLIPDPPQAEANDASNDANVSADGKTLVFSSLASNWRPDANSPNAKIIAVDLDTGLIEQVSRTSSGAALSGIEPAVSRDGRYVVFRNNGGALDVGVPTSGWQVVRKDRISNELRLVSASAGGEASDRESRDSSIADNGRWVAFRSGAFNLGFTNTSNGYDQVYVKDIDTGAIEAASLNSAGALPDAVNFLTRNALSGDGRYVVFSNNAPGMLPGLASNPGHVFLRDLFADNTEVVSRNSAGVPANSASDYAAISPGGRFVSFRSFATNLGRSGGGAGVYVRDRTTGTTTPVPLPTVAGLPANGCRESDVSDAGTVIQSCFFPSPMEDQVFLHVPGAAGTPFLLSSNAADVPGNERSGASVAVDASGLSMAFESLASNLDPNDSNARSDIFVVVDTDLLDRVFRDGFED